jgi:DNA-binding NtrC family response regulator
MPELAFYRHGEELLRIALAERTSVGRAAECDVSLPDPELAPVHVEVERRGETFHLVDRSGRGTRVRGVAVADAPLSDGCDLALGAWRVLFRDGRTGEDEPRGLAGGTTLRASGDAPSSAPARLRVRERGRERVLSLEGDVLSIGKDASNDLALDDPFVSARHVRLERRRSRWRVRDLGSTNGTFLAGVRVIDAELPAGAPLAIGDTELVLELAGEGAPRVATPAAFEGLVSRDPAMQQLFALIERVAPSGAAVTILGETGTGKELVARALHQLSDRRDRAFIPVNCSAIAETLIESELFGHEKGAFSGADRLRKGAFEEADGGTIFLDEIGELPLELQPKLLRALELGEVKRVGASRPIHVDVRILAATHRDLRAQVRAGKFREDLYYRLCVVPVSVPPLRARRGDVRALAELFLARAAPRGLALRFTPEALALLERHAWPGNVRQLKNVVQRALLFRGEGLAVGAAAIALEDAGAKVHAGDDDTLYVRGLTMEDLEREAIRLSLRRHRGKRAAVVEELALAKSTVMKRIAQWGLQDEGREAGAVRDDQEDAA